MYDKLDWHLTQIIGRLCSLILLFPISRTLYLYAIDSVATPKILKDYMKWGTRRAVVIRSSLSDTFRTGKALIIYYSETGNTKKVAAAIELGVRKAGLDPTVKNVTEAINENYYDYDLVCFGSPVKHALPPTPVMKFIHNNFDKYRTSPREVQLPSSPVPGKYALVFITFSGPHVGVNEALPAGKLLVQEFEHLGFKIKGEWYIAGEFHGWKKGSTRGRLGDIRGRPNPRDLKRVEEKTIELTESLSAPSENKVMWIRS